MTLSIFPSLANRKMLFLSALPAPKPSGDGEQQEEDLEEEVKPKLTQIQDAPKPPPKRAKQTVKITIPKLQDVRPK